MHYESATRKKAVTTKDFLKKMQDKQNRKNFRLLNKKNKQRSKNESNQIKTKVNQTEENRRKLNKQARKNII